MRKSAIYVLVLLLAVVAGYSAYSLLRPQSLWTTDSPEALEEFQQGLDARQRLYSQDAEEHFRKALDLDPSFVMARLMVLEDDIRNEDDWATARPMLEAIDTECLSSREKFFVEHLLARYSEDCPEEPDELVNRYLAEHPGDPYVLDEHCNWLWLRGDREEEASQCYQKLLAVEPNWVTAQNRLGYLAMSQGHFGDAEDFFLTYRYVAPDQANPHDSLAELMLLRGRYDEAHLELEAALTLRQDFCVSYLNLVRLAFLTNQPELSEDAVERAARHCGESMGQELQCRSEFHQQMLSGDWAALAQRWEDPCVQKAPSLRWMIHRAAVMTGQLKLAKAVEKAIQRQISSHQHLDMETTSLLLHLTAVRLVGQGDPLSAVDLFLDADERLSYRNFSNGSLKLFNRLNWSYAAALAGDDDTSAHLVAEVAKVNPRLAELFREGGLAMPSPELAATRD